MGVGAPDLMQRAIGIALVVQQLHPGAQVFDEFGERLGLTLLVGALGFQLGIRHTYHVFDELPRLWREHAQFAVATGSKTRAESRGTSR